MMTAAAVQTPRAFPCAFQGAATHHAIKVETMGETNHLHTLAGRLLEHFRTTGTVQERLWWAVAPRLGELPPAQQEAIRRAVGEQR